MLGVLIMVFSASAIGIVPALLVGVLVGGVFNVVVFGLRSTGGQSTAIEESTSKPTTHMNLGDAETQFKVGQAHRLGAGVPKNAEEAFAWIQKSAGQGFAEAQNMLGFMYSVGEGTVANTGEAYHWYLLSAQQGNMKGQTNLGCLLADLNSEFHDYAEASKWLSRQPSKAKRLPKNAWDCSITLVGVYKRITLWRQSGIDLPQHRVQWKQNACLM